MSAKIKIYRTYGSDSYLDKDPVIGQVKDMLEKERLFKKPGIVSEISGVSANTLYNWFHGETRRPQFATIAAVASAIGYQLGFRQAEKINVDEARKIAAKWRERQLQKQLTSKQKLIEKRKALRAANSGNGNGRHAG